MYAVTSISPYSQEMYGPNRERTEKRRKTKLMPYLNCINHPNLRWHCKIQAISGDRYNGQRNLFYVGTKEDISTSGHYTWNQSVPECSCPANDLRVIPEEETKTDIVR
jgi:hypothetical protein